MMRWIATAYLLRYRNDPSFKQIPDTQTLPDRRWIPVLIRCRDLGEDDLCRSFTDFLSQHLRKTELLPEDADVMRAVILDRIAKGDALLLVDGLDEITNPQVRIMFCQELERTAERYPEAHIVATSRIVGYRDMPYRMGTGFEHDVIAELTRGDKDIFAQRWVEITEQYQPSEEKVKRTQELLDALHSGDRIERLTGNPMLLTTLALVKRKVGKLPNRRTKLYAEAVSVLLNWNPRHYQTIEEDEAIPQLEYLAFEMCQQGVQQLTEDDVLDILYKLRQEYPNVRAIRRREPYVFLNLLEARSSILIKTGGLWLKQQGMEKPVWEFRHLTFQEYLAARALLDGRYPGRDRTKSLAEQVAPLAGSVKEARRRARPKPELEVVESWQEVLRLLVADCKDDDVDDVLRAILTPLTNEETSKTVRPRSVLATRCLADEPNVSEEVAQEVLVSFARAIERGDGMGRVRTTIDTATIEVGASQWGPKLQQCLVDEFFRRCPNERANPGGLLGMVQVTVAAVNASKFSEWFKTLVDPLRSSDPKEAATAALAVMESVFEQKVDVVPDMIPILFGLLNREPPLADAAAWALVWLSGGGTCDVILSARLSGCRRKAKSC